MVSMFHHILDIAFEQLFLLLQKVNCPAGSYHNAGLNKCVHCPKGMFQNKEAQTQCISCPTSTSTQQEFGAKNSTDCKGLLTII